MQRTKDKRAAGPRVAVVGAGLGGIAAAYKLSRAGLDFTVFERSAGPGGTWYDNTYPGCAVDIHAHQYSYSFHSDYRWSGTHPTQPELQRYCEDTIDRFGLRSHFRFGVGVESAIWDDERSLYCVTTFDGERHDFNIVISALGLLNNPKYPSWPGLDTFARPKFHSSRWDGRLDFTGKRVAVVGVGSSGAQIVPGIAPIAEHVYVFQREPGWVLPKGARPFTPDEQRRYARYPFLVKWNRLKAFQLSGKLMGAGDADSKHNRMLHEMSLQYLEASFEDEALRRLVTPDYPWGCKRPVLDDNFYPALTRDNVELVASAVTHLTETEVVAADGIAREVDVLIMATGFTTTQYLASLEVRGPGGRRLHDVWGDSETLLGMTVAGIPNFFMLYGPNSNAGGSIVGVCERQAEVAVRAARRMRRTGARVVDTHKGLMDAYVRWVDRTNERRRTAELGGCNNYYFNAATGRNVTQAHLTGFRYWALSRTLPPVALIYGAGSWAPAEAPATSVTPIRPPEEGIMDPELAAAVPHLPSFPFDDLEAAREGLAELLAGAPAVDTTGVTVSERAAPGATGAPDVPVRVYAPEARDGLAAGVLDIHSGGFAMGSVDFDHAANVDRSRDLGAVVVAPAYRLAPEHPYPAALEDCYAALRWMVDAADDLGVDPDRIAVVGDSAGAGLAAAVALAARDRGGPAIAYQMLVEPMLDDRCDTPSMHMDTVAWNPGYARLSWRHYLGSRGADGYAAPARAADLSGLPPTYLSVNELDCVRDEGLDYARRLLGAGVPVEVHCWPGAFHGFHLMVPGAGVSARALTTMHTALAGALAVDGSIEVAA